MLRHGRGAPLLQASHTKLFVSPTQVDHFLDFITSPHVVQDLPFGERTITLSTNKVVTVPNVIRMLIPETIVKQDLAYAEESNFTPLSRRTLLNILSVCAASTRKSLQGLDYESDDEIAEAEMVLSDLRGEVLENVQPLHPISFEHYNLCELMAQAKLSTFAISMLNKICDHFEIPTGDIKGRKKAPYLSRIEEFLKKCGCCPPS